MALAACVPGYVGIDQAEPGAELFARAERNFRSGAYRKALKAYSEYLSEFPSGIQAPTALFREAEIYRAWKDYRSARKYYHHLIDNYGGSHLVPEAMAGILQTLYDEKRYRDVIQQADTFLRRPGGVDRPVGVFVVLGDTYMALNSPVNAVYFYAKALEQVSPPKSKTISPRMKAAVKLLSVSDILALSERVTDAQTRGYLIYALGVKEAEEKRYADAARTLSQFIAAYPEHEYSGEAKRMLQHLEGGPASGSGGGKYVIGCMLPLTGSYESFGKKALRSIELALSEAAPGGAVQHSRQGYPFGSSPGRGSRPGDGPGERYGHHRSHYLRSGCCAESSGGRDPHHRADAEAGHYESRELRFQKFPDTARCRPDRLFPMRRR